MTFKQVGVSYLLEDYLYINHDSSIYFIRDLKRLTTGKEVDLLYLLPPVPPAVGYARISGRKIQIDYNTRRYYVSALVLSGQDKPLLRSA